MNTNTLHYIDLLEEQIPDIPENTYVRDLISQLRLSLTSNIDNIVEFTMDNTIFRLNNPMILKMEQCTTPYDMMEMFIEIRAERNNSSITHIQK